MKKSIALYLRPRSRHVWSGFAGAAVIACGGVCLAWLAAERHTAALTMSRDIAALRAASARKPAPIASKAEADQRKSWGQLKAERDFSWSPLFDALERAGNADIELLEFHPDKPSSTVVLRGEARDEAALLDFIEALSQNPVLQNVHLSHRKNRKRDRLETVSFELKAGIAKRPRRAAASAA